MRRTVFLALATALFAACSAAAPTAEPGPTSSPAPTAAIIPLAPALAEQLQGPWSETPFALPPDALAAIDAWCRAHLGDFLQSNLLLRVVDARGRGLLDAVYAGETSGMTTCDDITIDSSGEIVGGGGGSADNPNELLPLSGVNGLNIVLHITEEAPLTLTFIAGVAGSAIVRVEFEPASGPPIVASLANGWFAVWSYDFHGASPIRGFDAAGNEVATLEP